MGQCLEALLLDQLLECPAFPLVVCSMALGMGELAHAHAIGVEVGIAIAAARCVEEHCVEACYAEAPWSGHGGWVVSIATEDG